MAGLGVDFRVKEGRNDISTVDRAIGLISETVVRYTTSTGDGDWMKFLDRAVRAFKSNDLEYLAGEAPRDVKGGSELEEFLRRKNQQYMESAGEPDESPHVGRHLQDVSATPENGQTARR